MSTTRPAPHEDRGTIPPPPVPGSARYFALLYTPAEHRAALALLMALGDEISAGLARGLDHSVAHARLDWWRLEAERYAAGSARHPWLRASSAELTSSAGRASGGRLLNLQPLLEGAALDLAEGLQSGESQQRVHAALFVTAAEALGGASISERLRDQLAALGALTRHFERLSQDALAGARREHRQRLEAALAPLRHQPALAPLLVWATLAERRPERSRPLRALADNLRAWRIARRAAAGSGSAPAA